MRRSRVVVIGDTKLVRGTLTDAGAIASELALLDQVDVGFRSVAASHTALERLEDHFSRANLTTWLTVREYGDHSSDDTWSASLRMGDPIDIARTFDHDVVVLACRDVRLRRFLADLPVHTRPDVRILALVHFDDGVPEGERIEDALRFDAIVGSDLDFLKWGARSDLEIETSEAVMPRLHRRMHGTNARALISWGSRGTATLAEPLADLLTTPAESTPYIPGIAPEAAFVAAVAFGMARRQPYPAIASRAATAFATRCRDNQPPG